MPSLNQLSDDKLLLVTIYIAISVTGSCLHSKLQGDQNLQRGTDFCSHIWSGGTSFYGGPEFSLQALYAVLANMMTMNCFAYHSYVLQTKEAT